MSTSSASIDRLRIATPCPVGWEQMTGDDRVKFCDQCKLNVYNIAELSRTEVEELITRSEGRICARLYRRADGTVITKDCPVGLRALRMRVSKRVAAVFAAMVSLTGLTLGQNPSSKDEKTSCTPQTRITRADVTPRQPGGLSGSVVDPVGGAVPGAIVTITNVESKEIKATTTSETGRFEFASLTGTYNITIEAHGFMSLQIMDISIAANQIVTLESMIQISDQFLTGIVSMDFPVDPVGTRTPGTTIITEQMIRRLPIQ